MLSFSFLRGVGKYVLFLQKLDAMYDVLMSSEDVLGYGDFFGASEENDVEIMLKWYYGYTIGHMKQPELLG